MRCVIFCAGGFAGLAEPVRTDDYVIAADGGVAHVQALGLRADAVLGDFDSLGYVPVGAQVFPIEKDDTDSMLAVRHGLRLGCNEFFLYGALDGQRLDHTIANLQTLRFLVERGAVGHLIGVRQTVSVVRNGILRFASGCEGYLSLFCMGDRAVGVTIEGLHYTLTEGALSGGFPLGVSNAFIGESAAVRVADGCLIAVYDRTNPLPEVKLC